MIINLKMEKALSPEEVVRRYYPIRSQLGGLCKDVMEITMEAIPSSIYSSNMHTGFIFKMGSINCGISNDSITKSEYNSPGKIPLLMETFRRFEEQKIPVRLTGKYRTDEQTFDTDYTQTMPYILRAIGKLSKRKKENLK